MFDEVHPGTFSYPEIGIGILLSRSERGEDGQFRQVYRLADDSPNRGLLERYR